MQKTHSKKKIIAVGIILLFIGSIEATYITATVAKASNMNRLVAMTTEWCGSKEHKQQTVLLTSQQVTQVDRLIRSIQDCLKGGITEETVIRFKNAIATLESYGLLPDGITPEQCQHLLQGTYPSSKEKTVEGQIFHRNPLFANQSNSLCFIVGTMTKGEIAGPLQIFGAALALFGLIVHLNVLALIGLIFIGISRTITTISPISLLQRVTIQSGNITSVGLNGVQQFNISDDGNEGTISGFTGIKLGSNETGIKLLGVAIAIVT
jgi:hypothetical protein